MLRIIVSICYLISGVGMILFWIALILTIVAAGTLSEISFSLTSWQGVLLLGSGALYIVPLLVVWIGLFTFTLGCSKCKTSFFEPLLIPMRPWTGWLGARPIELSWRYLTGQRDCLNCGTPF